MTQASTGHSSPVEQFMTYTPGNRLLTYSAHLHTIGQHDNGFNLILPQHPPEMIDCLIQWSCITNLVAITVLGLEMILPCAAMYLFPPFPW